MNILQYRRLIHVLLRPSSVSLLSDASRMASAQALVLHAQMNAAVLELDRRYAEARVQKLELMRQLHSTLQTNLSDGTYNAGAVATGDSDDLTNMAAAAAVLTADDPILQWGVLHMPVDVREDE